MSLSMNDILRDLGVASSKEVPVPVVESVNVPTEAIAEDTVQKIATYLDYLASPDSIVDELAKLAVLQDFINQRQISMDKVAELQLEVVDTEKNGMLKVASDLIKDQYNQIIALKNQLEIRAEAEKVASKLHKAGHIDASNILEKVAELSAQSKEELRTLDKALDLTKEGGRISLGSLSTKPDSESFLDYLLN